MTIATKGQQRRGLTVGIDRRAAGDPYDYEEITLDCTACGQEAACIMVRAQVEDAEAMQEKMQQMGVLCQNCATVLINERKQEEAQP